MTCKMIARLTSLFAFAMLLTLTAPAFAQEAPLSLRTIGEASVAAQAEDADPRFVLLPPQPIYPIDNQPLDQSGGFAWTNSGGNAYKLKITVVETGEKFTLKPAYTCNSSCYAPAMPTAIFNRVRDGQTIKWTVVSKFDSTTLKSTVATAVINEVDTVTLVSPINNGSVALGGLQYLRFNSDSSINDHFKVIVKEKLTGKTVLTRLVSRGNGCYYSECKMDVYPDDRVFAFKAGTSYTWVVVAYGLTGESQKSQKGTFSIQ